MKGKVFCIGRGKTGTTSLERALSELGYRMGDQASGEFLLRDWARRDFRRIVELASTAEAFQDIPFSLPYTYQTLDQEFPGARFVLSVRGSADEWYESMVRYHTQIVGTGRRPTAADLKVFGYRYPGWLWEAHHFIYDICEGQEYDRDIYLAQYERHNEDVRRYFRYRPEALLELDLSEPDAMSRLCGFLGVEDCGGSMPHLNRSR